MREILGTFQWSNCEKVTIALKNGSIDVFVDGGKERNTGCFFGGASRGGNGENLFENLATQN